MNRMGTIGLGLVAWLALSGIASAKSSEPTSVDVVKADAAAPAPAAVAPGEIKATKSVAKRTATTTTETEPTRNPYAVPLFQQARSLK